jgi:hypothetical protein
MSFRTTALHGVAAGYSVTMLILGAEALLAAAAWPVLIRRATRPVLG